MYAWSAGWIRSVGIGMATDCFHASDGRFWLIGWEDLHTVYIEGA